MESVAEHRYQALRQSDFGGNPGTRRDPAYLADNPSGEWRRFVITNVLGWERNPSVEVPLGDFFCNGWGVRCNIASLPVAVNPAGAFNCYWEMPFRKSALITLENLSADPVPGFYYQITYALTEVPEDRAYLHAQWRRTNPIPYKEVHTIIDGICGSGAIRWHLSGLGRAQQWLVGRGRNQILHGW